MSEFLNLIRPIITNDQIRIGRNNDGGYVVNNCSLKNSKLLSFGINDDWSFEQDFLKLSPNGVVMYDGSISKANFLNTFFNDILEFFSIKFIIKSFNFNFFISHLKKTISDFVIYYNFIKFLDNPKITFNSEFVSNKITTTRLSHIINKYKEQDLNYFLKIDIEGHEYRIIDDILNNHQLINGMAIEFHEIDLFYDKFEKIIISLKEYFYITHIHANNYSEFSQALGSLCVYEISFINKQLHPSAPIYFEKGVYNKRGLDQSCHPHLQDYVIEY